MLAFGAKAMAPLEELEPILTPRITTADNAQVALQGMVIQGFALPDSYAPEAAAGAQKVMTKVGDGGGGVEGAPKPLVPALLASIPRMFGADQKLTATVELVPTLFYLEGARAVVLDTVARPQRATELPGPLKGDVTTEVVSDL